MSDISGARNYSEYPYPVRQMPLRESLREARDTPVREQQASPADQPYHAVEQPQRTSGTGESSAAASLERLNTLAAAIEQSRQAQAMQAQSMQTQSMQAQPMQGQPQSLYGQTGQQQTTHPAPQPVPAAVPGQIEIDCEVVEKVAALAAVEVAGVCGLGADLERMFEPVRDRGPGRDGRASQRVRARIADRQAAIDVTISIEFGHVVMDVASAVKSAVSQSVTRMLGLRVMEVNVRVDDVRRAPTSSSGEDHDK